MKTLHVLGCTSGVFGKCVNNLNFVCLFVRSFVLTAASYILIEKDTRHRGLKFDADNFIQKITCMEFDAKMQAGVFGCVQM